MLICYELLCKNCKYKFIIDCNESKQSCECGIEFISSQFIGVQYICIDNVILNNNEYNIIIIISTHKTNIILQKNIENDNINFTYNIKEKYIQDLINNLLKLNNII